MKGKGGSGAAGRVRAQPLLAAEGVTGMRGETPKGSMAKACGKMKREQEETWGRAMSARKLLLVLLFRALKGIPIVFCQRMKAWEG